MTFFQKPMQDMLKLMEALPDLYLVLAPDFTIITATNTYLKATFKERESVIGKHVFDVFPDNPNLATSDATSNLRKSLEWVLEHKQGHRMELQRYDVTLPGAEANFAEKYWQPYNMPYLDEDGNVVCLIHKVEDVTDQVLTTRQLKAEIEQADLNLKISQNQALALQELNEHLAEDNKEIKASNAVLSESQLVLQQLNAELDRRVDIRTQQLYQAQKQAELQKERLENFFMQAPAAICVLGGEELVFELVNPEFQNLFKGRSLLGKPIKEALPELAGQPIENILREVYLTGQTYFGKETQVDLARHADAGLEQIYFNFIYQARFNDTGQVDGILVFAYEVTDLVKARQSMEKGEKEAQALAEELRVANEQLVRTNIDLDNFIYTASHDLKAPIANIEGLFMALNKRVSQHYRDKDVLINRMIEESIAKFKSTITHLTEIAKVHHGIDSQKEELSLRQVINDVLLDIAPLIEKEGASITLDLEVEQVWYASKNLRSIIYNLVSNGIKYRAEDRKPIIKISTKQQHDKIVLEVKDNGMGIEEDQIGKLFTMFRRFHNHVEGTGVGLYMIKRMIENHGGSIEVHSEPGQGSTFRVFL